MKRHRHQEFIRFLNAIEAPVPKRKAIHAVVDNYATHKHPRGNAVRDRFFATEGLGSLALGGQAGWRNPSGGETLELA